MTPPHADRPALGPGIMDRVQASGVLPTGGGAVAIIIGSIFVAVIVAVVAIETNRNPYGWMVVGFVASFVIISAIHALA